MKAPFVRIERITSAGFTMVELIIVIILTGILAITALPKMTDSFFNDRGFYDSTKATIQHARRIAMASRRFVCVNFTANTLSITRDTAVPDGKATISCATAVNVPSPQTGCGTNQVCTPSGISFGGTTSLIFDPLGRLVSAPDTLAGAATISVTGQTNITISPGTGIIE